MRSTENSIVFTKQNSKNTVVEQNSIVVSRLCCYVVRRPSMLFLNHTKSGYNNIAVTRAIIQIAPYSCTMQQGQLHPHACS